MRVLAEGLGGVADAWQDMLVVLAALSMIVGNVVAIAQSNIKRMLAYSTISHVGFIFLGVLAANPSGYRAAMFYTLTYVVMTTAAFGVVLWMSRKGFEADALDDYKGLNRRNPWFAFVMLLVDVRAGRRAAHGRLLGQAAGHCGRPGRRPHLARRARRR